MRIETIHMPEPKALPNGSLRLAKLEAVIETGHKIFIEVGKALMEINRDRLYRERGFTTFESYCNQKWGINRQHAYRKIQAAKLVQNLSPQGDNLPVSEKQARELVGLSQAEQREVAANVVFDAVTPTQVREIVQAIKPSHTTTHIQPKVCDPATAQDFITAGLRRFTADELVKALAIQVGVPADVIWSRILDFIEEAASKDSAKGTP